MIKKISKVILFILWLATVVAAVVWAFVPDPPFEPEPITVILGLVSGAATGLLNEYSKAIEEEEYSTVYALAFGYVNNFLEPLATQLMSQDKDPVINIFLPETLADLEPRSVERLMAEVRKRYSSEVLKLELREGRARDVITIHKSSDPSLAILFDFPNTLLTLNALIDYKVESKKGQFSGKAREALGRKYIGIFRDTILRMAAEKGFGERVRFVNKDLQF